MLDMTDPQLNRIVIYSEFCVERQTMQFCYTCTTILQYIVV